MRLLNADALAMKLRHMGYMDENEEVQEVIDRFAKECDGDMISRKAAVEALKDAENHAFNSYYQGLIKAHKIIADLPSAEPEIIRCKDCRYNNDCEIQYSAQSGDEFFCGCAERKDNE